MNNECIPLHEGPYTSTITVHISTNPVVGKTFVGPLLGRQSGGLSGLAADPLATGDGSNFIVAGPPAAGGKVGGVACWDQVAGAKVPLLRGAGTILPVTSGAAVAVGAKLAVDAQGRVVTAATGNVIVGVAHSAAGGAAVDVEVELFPIDDNNISP